MKRRSISLYYCAACKATTRHAEAETTSTCLRCGAVKTATRIVKSSATKQPENSDSEWI